MPGRIVTALLAAALLAIALVPAVNASKGGKHDRDRDCGERSKGFHKRALDVVGLTDDGRLICFSEKDPDDARTIGRIKNLKGDDRLVGIDYRPATGELYGLGNKGGVYVVDDESGKASLKSNLNVPLMGTSFGVDFNPVVDRLRIISDTGQNLADNVDTNNDTVTDGTLTNAGPAGTPPPTALGVTGAAYTNNDADPNTGTTLFDIDSALDQVSVQSRPASGQLAPTGKLLVDTGPSVGADIYSTIRGGATVRVQGFASLAVNGKSGFYEVNLLQGRAGSRGSFAPRNVVTGIAVPLNQR